MTLWWWYSAYCVTVFVFCFFMRNLSISRCLKRSRIVLRCFPLILWRLTLSVTVVFYSLPAWVLARQEKMFVSCKSVPEPPGRVESLSVLVLHLAVTGVAVLAVLADCILFNIALERGRTAQIMNLFWDFLSPFIFCIFSILFVSNVHTFVAVSEWERLSWSLPPPQLSATPSTSNSRNTEFT